MRRQVRLLQALRFEFLAPIFGVSIAIVAVVVVLVPALVGVLVVMPVLCSYRCSWCSVHIGIVVVVVVAAVASGFGGFSSFVEGVLVPFVWVFARFRRCSRGVSSTHAAATATAVQTLKKVYRFTMYDIGMSCAGAMVSAQRKTCVVRPHGGVMRYTREHKLPTRL